MLGDPDTVLLLFLVLMNVIVDALAVKYLRRIQRSYQEIILKTEQLELTVRSGWEQLGPVLIEHGQALAKSIGGVLGYHRGKAEKAQNGALEQLEGLAGTLIPITQMLSQAPSNAPNDKGLM